MSLLYLSYTNCSNQTLTRNEASEGLLVLMTFPVRLPPVGVVLASDVEDVSLLEGQAELSARHIWVLGWVIAEVCFYMHL